MKRITIPEIKKHPWFLKNLPKDLMEGEKTNYAQTDGDEPLQSVEEITQIVQEARTPGKAAAKAVDQSLPLGSGGSLEPDDAESELVESDVSGDYFVASPL